MRAPARLAFPVGLRKVAGQEKLASGVKARAILLRLSGPTEVGPFPELTLAIFFRGLLACVLDVPGILERTD